MLYLLDTNTCIFIINNQPEYVRQRFAQIPISSLCISSLTLYELDRGARKGLRSKENLERLEELKLVLIVAPFATAEAHQAGLVFDQLKRSGTPIGPIDTLIAAHALTLKATLVTNNTKEFSRVLGLQLKDWIA